MFGCQEDSTDETQLALLSVSEKEWPSDLEQPNLVAEAFLWLLPVGAPYSRACPPSYWQLTLTLLTTAWSSFCPILLPLPLVTSLFHMVALPVRAHPPDGRGLTSGEVT